MKRYITLPVVNEQLVEAGNLDSPHVDIYTVVCCTFHRHSRQIHFHSTLNNTTSIAVHAVVLHKQTQIKQAIMDS